MCFAGGTRVLCCYPPNTYNDNYVTNIKNKLLSFSDDHTCPERQLFAPIHAKRNEEIEQSKIEIKTRKQVVKPKIDNPIAKTMDYSGTQIQSRDFKSLGGYETLQILMTALPLGTKLSGFILEAFNDIIGSKTNLRVRDLKAAVRDDPYGDPIFSLAWMLCEWDKGPQILNDISHSEEICVLPPEGYDFSGVPSSSDDDSSLYGKREVAAQFPGGDPQSSDSLDEQIANLSKRIFWADIADIGNDPTSQPPTGRLLQAVMNDNLPLLYIQRIRYRAGTPYENQDTILEVVYDLQGRPDLQGTTAAEAAGPNREDRFAVFHFHTLGYAFAQSHKQLIEHNDANRKCSMEPSGSNNIPDYPMINYFHVCRYPPTPSCDGKH